MKRFLLPVLAFTLCSAMSLHGAMVFTGLQEKQPGGGFGNFENFLTTSGGQQDTTRSGCTSLVGGVLNTADCDLFGGADFAGGDEHPPGDQNNPNFNNVFAFGGNASSIRIILNSAEQGQQDLTSLTVGPLYLTLYSDAGTVLWSSAGVECGAGTDCVDNGDSVTVTTLTGIGNFGLVFALDADQAEALQLAGTDPNTLNPIGTLGLASTLTGAGGGLDTYVFSQQRLNPDPVVPEPGTWAMIAGGLGLIFVARFRRS